MSTKKMCPKCNERESGRSEGRNHGWCRKCMYDAQKKRWKDRKIKAVMLLGGKCFMCGYDRNYAASDFHHKDPDEKECSWNKLRLKSWDKIVNELNKCVLLCANCHREFHNQGSFISYEGKDNILLNEFQVTELAPTGKCANKDCNSDVYGTTFCSVKCSNKMRRKVKRPSKEVLTADIESMSWLALGRKYGVSDNAVRKWARSYGIL